MNQTWFLFTPVYLYIVYDIWLFTFRCIFKTFCSAKKAPEKACSAILRGFLTHGTIENLKWVKFYARYYLVL